jgi:fumarate reductase subunit D
LKRSSEPFFWALFSAGGTLAAFLFPAIAIVLWLAPAFGWSEPLSREQLVALLEPIWVRLGLWVFVSLCFFHWGHRFRFTLYDGLQLKHLFGLIAAVCYGGATALSLLAAYTLLNFS